MEIGHQTGEMHFRYVTLKILLNLYIVMCIYCRYEYVNADANPDVEAISTATPSCIAIFYFFICIVRLLTASVV